MGNRLRYGDTDNDGSISVAYTTMVNPSNSVKCENRPKKHFVKEKNELVRGAVFKCTQNQIVTYQVMYSSFYIYLKHRDRRDNFGTYWIAFNSGL